MPNLPTPGDAEALFIGLLRTGLADGTPVATRAPTENVPQYVRVSRAGGPAPAPFLDAPMIIVECWATDEIAAERLSARTRALLLASDGQRSGTAAISDMHEIGGPVAFDDPENTIYHRYQHTIQCVLRWYPT